MNLNEIIILNAALKIDVILMKGASHKQINIISTRKMLDLLWGKLSLNMYMYIV